MTTYDKRKDPRWKKFEKLCIENGIDHNDDEYGSVAITAWMWFCLGWAEGADIDYET